MSALENPASLIPQAGAMCLLDEVASWDDRSVVCVSTSHRRSDHPLRRDGTLASLHLIEYAAQAMAVHAALTESDDDTRPPLKVLAGVRDVDLHSESLGEEQQLFVEAERLLAMSDGVLYQFRVRAGDRLLAEGRLTVVAAGEAAS